MQKEPGYLSVAISKIFPFNSLCFIFISALKAQPFRWPMLSVANDRNLDLHRAGICSFDSQIGASAHYFVIKYLFRNRHSLIEQVTKKSIALIALSFIPLY
jgi:hypothetical protein